ncbi:MAG: hypothetical protein CMP68_01725 [Flavobacteriales bacterium]|nr:hypothetical protein [Flavobacteriales bacterium]|tara:strand:- start:13251 stop:13625 length:375 start_codon:yes stop_codon:yes gene_type:complete
MKRIYIVLLFLISLFITSCYEDPFYKLDVYVVDSNFEAVENANVVILVRDEDGQKIIDSIVEKVGETNSSGVVSFEFENLGLFNIEVEKEIFEMNSLICGRSNISLEENETKSITIQATEDNCN